jgi:cytochrome b6-f complex iron-sulfur subunit
MTRTKLAVVPCGDGCDRRAVLLGLGVGAAALVTGCLSSGSSLGSGNATSCGTGHCLDLGDSANKALATVGGALLIDIGADTVMVIRASETSVIALSAVCTHAGCTMDYDSGAHELTCPCHGSVFSQTGQVITGPARKAVKVYAATLANNLITVG